MRMSDCCLSVASSIACCAKLAAMVYGGSPTAHRRGMHEVYQTKCAIGQASKLILLEQYTTSSHMHYYLSTLDKYSFIHSFTHSTHPLIHSFYFFPFFPFFLLDDEEVPPPGDGLLVPAVLAASIAS